MFKEISFCTFLEYFHICVFCIEMDSFWNHVIYVWIV